MLEIAKIFTDKMVLQRNKPTKAHFVSVIPHQITAGLLVYIQGIQKNSIIQESIELFLLLTESAAAIALQVE